MSPEPAKRTRISQACVGCRSKKTKCDGKHPQCSQCFQLGLTCSYGPAPKKRGLPAGHSGWLERKVRLLEYICSLFVDHVPGGAEAIEQLLLDTSSSRLIHRIAGWKKGDPDDLQGSWNETSLANLVDKLLNDASENASSGWYTEKSPEGPLTIDRNVSRLFWRQSPSQQKYDSERILLDATSSRMRESNLQRLSPLPMSLKWRPMGIYEMSRDQNTRQSLGSLSLVQDLETLNSFWDSNFIPAKPPPLEPEFLPPLPANTHSLLDVYFAYTHIWLPVVDKFKVVSLSHRYPRQTSQLFPDASGLSLSSVALLWSILAYASTQTQESINSSSLSSHAYKMARDLIPSEASFCDADTVRTLTLLSLVDVGRGWWSEAWLHIGTAGQIATDCGLGGNKSINNNGESRLNRRTFHGCVVVEALIAARLGRSPHLKNLIERHQRDPTYPDFNQEDGWEEWGSWEGLRGQNMPSAAQSPTRSLSVFNQLVRLVDILSELLITVNESKTPKFSPQVLNEFSARLLDWELSLDSYSSQRISNGGNFLPHFLNLHLVQASVRNLLDIVNNEYNFSSDSRAMPKSRNWSLLTEQLSSIFTATFGTQYTPPLFPYIIQVAAQSPRCTFDIRSALLRSLGDLGATWPAAQVAFQMLTTARAPVTLPECFHSDSTFSPSIIPHSVEQPETMSLPLEKPSMILASSTESMTLQSPNLTIAEDPQNGTFGLGQNSDGFLNEDFSLQINDADVLQFMENLGFHGDIGGEYNFTDHFGLSPESQPP